MALTRLVAPQTTVQPAPPTTATDVQAQAALEQQGIKSEQATQQIAGQVHQFAANMMREEALKMAQTDAAKSVTYDPQTGQPIVDESAKGWGGLVYNKAFDDAALANYRTASLGALNKQVDTALARHPTNPVAVAAEVQPYVEGLFKGMPEHFRQQMAPHFDGVINAAKQSALAGKARSDIKGITDGIPYNENKIMLDRANIVAHNQANPANDALFDQRLDDLDRMRRQANEPEATIAQKRELLKKRAWLHGVGVRLGAMAAGAEPGSNTYGAILNQIDQYVMNPDYTGVPDTREILTGYVSRGQGKAAAAESAVAYKGAQDVADLTGKIHQVYRSYDAGHIDSTQRDQALRDIEMQRSTLMAGVRPTQALSIMTAGRGMIDAQQAHNTSVAVAAYQKADDNLMNTYGATYTNAAAMATSGMSDEIRHEGKTQVRQLANDPYLNSRAKWDPRAAALRGNIDQQVAGYAIADQSFDMTRSLDDVTSGRMNPTHYPDYVKGLRDKNLLDVPGGISTERAVAAMAQGRKAWTETKQRDDAAASALSDFQKTGTPMNASQRAANQAALNARNAGGEVVVDEQGNVIPRPARIDADGVKHALGFYQQNGHIPEGYAKEAAAVASRPGADESTQESMVNLVRGYMDITRRNIGKNYKNATDIETAVVGYTREQFGDKILQTIESYEKGYNKRTADEVSKDIAAAGGDRGPDASKLDPANIVAAWGGSKELVNALIDARDKPGQGFWQTTGRLTFSVFGLLGRDVVGGMNVFSQEELRTVFAGKAPAGLDQSNVRYSTDVADDLLNYAIDYKKKNGTRDEKLGLNPDKQAAISWAIHNKDKLSFVRGADPVTGLATHTMMLNGFYDEFNQKQGVTYGQKGVNSVIAQRVRALMPDVAAKVDLDTLTVTSQRHESGRMIHRVAALSKNGQTPIEIMDVRPDDPLFKAEFTRVGQAVAHVMAEREANSIMDKYIWLSFFRESEFNKIRDDIVKQGGKADPGDTWVRFAQAMRGLIGADESISQEALDKWGSRDVARILRENGLMTYILNGASGTEVTTGMFERQGEIGQKTQRGLLPVGDPGRVNPNQAFELEQQEEAALARQRMGAPRAPGGDAFALPFSGPSAATTSSLSQPGPSADPRPPQNRTPTPPAPPEKFTPEGGGYDLESAQRARMRPSTEEGPNKGHMGTVAPATLADRKKHGLPPESYLVLKGRSHPTWNLGVEGEEARGFEVRKFGDRYYSVPKDWKPDKGKKVK